MMDDAKALILIAALTFVLVTCIGVVIAMMAGRAAQRRQLQEKIGESRFAGSGQKPEEPARAGILRLLERVGHIASHGQASTTLWEQLVQAGHYSSNAATIYIGVKLLLFIGGAGTTVALVVPAEMTGLTKMLLIVLGGAVLFFLPNLVLMLEQRERQAEIRQHLPQAVDLLEICVSSGIGLNMAWNMVANEIHKVSPTLADEMALTNFEIHLGADRAEAMRNMARRTGADELGSLAAILVQTDRFGTSVAKALREFAISMREERHFRAEESAEKMTVKLVIPMVLFIFPAVVIVVIGPAIVRIWTDWLSKS